MEGHDEAQCGRRSGTDEVREGRRKRDRAGDRNIKGAWKGESEGGREGRGKEQCLVSGLG